MNQTKKCSLCEQKIDRDKYDKHLEGCRLKFLKRLSDSLQPAPKPTKTKTKSAPKPAPRPPKKNKSTKGKPKPKSFPEWDKLNPNIKETWKIDPSLVLKVAKKRGTIEQYEALTGTHRYLWTLVRSRQQFTCKKTPLKAPPRDAEGEEADREVETETGPTPRPEPAPRSKKYRCESCFGMAPESELVAHRGDVKCERCRRLWYVVACVPGEDTKARKDILKRARIEGIPIHRVLIPRIKQLEDVQGSRVRKTRRYTSGYVVVQMTYDDDCFHAIRGARGVIGLLPLRPPLPRNATDDQREAYNAWTPTELESEEAALLLLREEERKGDGPADPEPFKVGDKVRITAGAWKDSTGMVIEYDGKSTYKVVVQLLGRDVPVPVEYEDLSSE